MDPIINSASNNLYNTIQSDELFDICHEIKKLIIQSKNIFVYKEPDPTNPPDPNAYNPYFDPTVVKVYDYNSHNKAIHEQVLKLINHNEFISKFHTYIGSITGKINIVNKSWYEEHVNRELMLLQSQSQQKITDTVFRVLKQVLSGDPNLGSTEAEIIDNVLNNLFDVENGGTDPGFNLEDLKQIDISTPGFDGPVVGPDTPETPQDFELFDAPLDEDQPISIASANDVGLAIEDQPILADDSQSNPIDPNGMVPLYGPNGLNRDEVDDQIFSINFYNKIKITPNPHTYLSVLCLQDSYGQIIARFFFDNIKDKWVYDYAGYDYLVETLDFTEFPNFIKPNYLTKYIKFPDNVKQFSIDKYEILNSIFINLLENKIDVFGKFTDYHDHDGRNIYMTYMANFLPKLIAYDFLNSPTSLISPFIKHIFVIKNRIAEYKNDNIKPVIEFKFPKLHDEDLEFIFGNK